MAAPSLPHQPTTKRRDTSPAPSPQIIQPTINDGTNWHIFTSAARLVPPQQRMMFSFMVLARLIDSPHLRPELLMAACDGAIVETACATDKWAVRQ